MSWYKQSKVEDGNYILDPDGRLHPCHSHSIDDCLPYVADQYNVLTENQNRYSTEYSKEILDNGFATVTLGRGVDIKNTKPLNGAQQTTVNALNKNRR